MPKRRLTLSVSLPSYRHPRNEWRRLIHQAAQDAQAARNVHYLASDKLEVHVTLNLSPSAALHHDVDNRLKDILDALQGRAGGSQRPFTLWSLLCPMTARSTECQSRSRPEPIGSGLAGRSPFGSSDAGEAFEAPPNNSMEPTRPAGC